MPWSASRKYAGPDHPWAHFSKHSMSSVLSIHQDSHINNESSVSAATQNFWKEQNLTNFSTKLNWSTLHSVTGYEVTGYPLPHLCANMTMSGTKGNTDMGHSPFHRAALEHSHMEKYAVLSSLQVAGQNAFILHLSRMLLFWPFLTPVLSIPLVMQLCADHYHVLHSYSYSYRCPLLMCTSKGRQQFILSASTDRTWEYEQAFKVSHSQLRHNQQLLWQHNTATPVSAATKV